LEGLPRHITPPTTQATITQVWGADLVAGATNIYSVPTNAYVEGRLPAHSSFSDVGYIIRSARSANFQLYNNTCRPRTSGCSAALATVTESQYSTGGTAIYQTTRLSITNRGSTLISNTKIKLDLLANSYLTQQWNLRPFVPSPPLYVGNNSTHTCDLFNLPPGQTSTVCGFTVVSPSGALPAVSVQNVQTICI